MSCDEYIDIASLNAYYKRKYWNECEYEYILIAQEKMPSNLEGFTQIINCPSNYNWMERLDSVLDSIDAEYILLLCEDFFPYVDIKKINFDRLILEMEENNIGLMKIFPRGSKRNLKKMNEYLWEYTPSSPFRISYCVGLWKKSYLKNFTKCHLNVWQAEYYNSISSLDYSEKIVSNFEIPCNAYMHVIMSGTWIRKSYNRMKKDGVPLALLSSRNKMKLLLYLKGIIFNIVMFLCPNVILKLQHRVHVGRGSK